MVVAFYISLGLQLKTPIKLLMKGSKVLHLLFDSSGDDCVKSGNNMQKLVILAVCLPKVRPN